MADTNSFVVPAWLEGQDAETIHQRMMRNLPDDIDDTEGGFPWDFTKPTALEKAELLEFEMLEAVKIMHYMFAYGIYLDYHATAYGLTRRSAVAASGELNIVGSPGTTIPAGFLFAVPASGDAAAIVFATDAEATIGVDGTATVTVTAQETGTIGNVAADTVVIMAQPIPGIESVTNPEAFTGGAAEENDDTLKQRIKEYLQTSDISFVGCDADYKRWAKEVDGVGEVIVIPEWNGPGTVKVVLLDLNGEPANTSIIEDVYNHIVSPNDRKKRIAPIGATVTVTAPATKTIDVACKLALAAGGDYNTVVAEIKSRISVYFKSAEIEIKKNYVGSLILGVDGVEDYTNLTLNGSIANIPVSQDEYPELGTFSTDAEV